MALIDIFVLAAGYAACWFTKDWVLKKVQGAEAFAKNVEAKAAAARAAIK